MDFSCLLIFIFSGSVPLTTGSSALPPNYKETYPRLSLKSYKLFAPNRTVNLSQVPIRLPRVYDELVFECNSTLPTKWLIAGLQARDPTVKRVEVSKWRYHESHILEKFRSTIRISFSNPREFLDLFCENQCQELKGRVDRCQYYNSYVTANEFWAEQDEEEDEEAEARPKELRAFFKLRFARGNKFTLSTSQRLNPTPMPETSLRDKAHYCDYALHVDLERGTYECTRADDKAEEVASLFIPCGNPDECDAILKASNNREGCKLPIYERNCTSEICSELRHTTTPFVLACGEDARDNVARAFFKTLNSVLNGQKRLYDFSDRKHMNKLEKTQLIRVLMSSGRAQEYGTMYESDPTIIYTGYRRQFTCTGLKSFFTYGFRWILLFRDNSTVDLGIGDKEYANDSAHLYVSRKLIYFNRSDTMAVICEAPNWNSLQGTNSTWGVTVRDCVKPSFPNYPGAAGPGHNDTIVVQRNSTNSSDTLDCPRTGSPLAEIRWELDGVTTTTENEAAHALEQYYSRSETFSSSQLTLHPGHPYENVVCEARNNAGVARIRFVFTKGQEVPSPPNYPLIFGVFFTVLLSLCIVMLGGYWKHRKLLRKYEGHITEEEMSDFFQGQRMASHKAFARAYDVQLEVSPDSLVTDGDILGCGTYGQVRKGRIGLLKVAVKTTKACADVFCVKALLSEIKIMSYVGQHPNIVNLIGASTIKLPHGGLKVIMEFCERGDLLSLLREYKNNFVKSLENQKSLNTLLFCILPSELALNAAISLTYLYRWALDIAHGMEFISSKKIIHGDLAARNILITHDLKAKVSDFGLSKQLYEYAVYVKKGRIALPARWMAYESLRNLSFSIESDVWSYGVVLWEIFSLGLLPYHGMSWSFASWQILADGVRMEKPTYACDAMYSLMRQTWELEPRNRPTFTSIKEMLSSMLY